MLALPAAAEPPWLALADPLTQRTAQRLPLPAVGAVLKETSLACLRPAA
jgi:hypothetical protein